MLQMISKILEFWRWFSHNIISYDFVLQLLSAFTLQYNLSQYNQLFEDLSFGITCWLSWLVPLGVFAALKANITFNCLYFSSSSIRNGIHPYTLHIIFYSNIGHPYTSEIRYFSSLVTFISISTITHPRDRIIQNN